MILHWTHHNALNMHNIPKTCRGSMQQHYAWRMHVGSNAGNHKLGQHNTGTRLDIAPTWQQAANLHLYEEEYRKGQLQHALPIGVVSLPALGYLLPDTASPLLCPSMTAQLHDMSLSSARFLLCMHAYTV